MKTLDLAEQAALGILPYSPLEGATEMAMPTAPMGRSSAAEHGSADRPSAVVPKGTADAVATFEETFSVGDHVDVGRALLERLRALGEVVFSEGTAYRYSDSASLWTPIDESEESRIVQGFSGAPLQSPNADEESGGKTKILKLSESAVRGAIRLAHDQVADPRFFESAPRGVAFANAFVAAGPTGIEVRQHGPDNRARTSFPFEFSDGATPANFLRFLGELFRDDEDRDAKVDFVREFAGASLVGIAPTYQRCMLAIGAGANGKSTLGHIVQAAMPKGTVVAVAPQDWGKEYYRAMLAGARLNVVNELPEREILASEAFKNIVTGDEIVGRPICRAPFSFRPVAGHYFAANRLPETADSTDGFFRRFVVIAFRRQFIAAPDATIAERIVAAELPAIVSWLVVGASNLIARGSYALPSSHGALIADWRLNANPVARFLADRTRPVREGEAGAAGASLYRAYTMWCAANGHRAFASNKFSARLVELGVERRRTMVGTRYAVEVVSDSEANANGSG